MIVPSSKIFIAALIVLFFITSCFVFFTNRGKNISGWLKFGIIFFGSTLGSALFMLLVLSTTNEITIVREGGKYSNINIWGDYTVTDDDDKLIVELTDLDLFENYLFNGSGKQLIQYPVVYSSDGNSMTEKQPLFYEDGMLSKREYGIDFYFTIPPDTIVTEGNIPFSIRTERLEKVIKELNQNCPITVMEGCTFRGITENSDTLIHTYIYDENLDVEMQKDWTMDFMKTMVRNNPLLKNLLVEYGECARTLVLSIEKPAGNEVYRMAVSKEDMKDYLE